MNSVDSGMKYQVFEMSKSLGNEIKVNLIWKTIMLKQFRDMDKKVRGQKLTQNTFDKMGRRLPDALGDKFLEDKLDVH